MAAFTLISIPAWAEAPKSEVELLARIAATGGEVLTSDIADTLHAFGCGIHTLDHNEVHAFVVDLAHHIAQREGYAGNLSQDAIGKIADLVQGPLTEMVERGAIVVDEVESIATLVDCE